MRTLLCAFAMLMAFFLNVNAQTDLIDNGDFSSGGDWTTTGAFHFNSLNDCCYSCDGYAFGPADGQGYLTRKKPCISQN